MMNGKEKIPIIYFIGGASIGGMEQHLLQLLRGLSPVYQPRVCCLDACAPFLALLEQIRAPAANLQMANLLTPRRSLKLLQILRLLHQIRPRIVHCYGFTCDVVIPLLARSVPGIRVITTRRGQDTRRRHQRLRGWTSPLADRVICVSRETAEFAVTTEGLPAHQVCVIPNGVSVPQTEGRRFPQGSVRFGTLGRLKPVKGTDLLVEAFLRLGGQVNAELWIGGSTDGKWGQALVNQVSLNGASRGVRFLGRLDEPTRFLSKLDVFVLPSRSEGMSNALLEAMAAALPCVATDVGSNRAVLDGTGIVCRPDSGELAQAMLELYRSPGRREMLGSKARSRASREFSISTMIRRHEQVYEEVLGNAAQ